MATFALLDDNNRVVNTVKVSNDVILRDGVEHEQLGIDYLRELLPQETGRWVQTWFGTTKRGLTAGIGMIYNEELDRFDLDPEYHGGRTEDLSYHPFGNPDIDPATITVRRYCDLTEEEKQALLEKMKNVSVQD